MEYPKGWQEENNKLVKVFEFKDFVKGVDFVDSIVPIAEELGHHPDVQIYSYNKVRISLTTHDEGNTITEKDIQLAKEIDSLV
jgi:4a-hydroxytetrahydrobiopterin dehydratase